MAWNSSAFRYSDDPGPLCAKDISPGFCFSSAINSGIDFTGRSGLTTRTNGDRNSNETVWNSLSVSNGTDLNRVGLAAIRLAAANAIWPAGGDLATAAVAITPPPPPRFSISTGLPMRSCTYGAIARSTTSMLPPGGNGTTNVIGPVG